MWFIIVSSAPVQCSTQKKHILRRKWEWTCFSIIFKASITTLISKFQIEFVFLHCWIIFIVSHLGIFHKSSCCCDNLWALDLMLGLKEKQCVRVCVEELSLMEMFSPKVLCSECCCCIACLEWMTGAEWRRRFHVLPLLDPGIRRWDGSVRATYFLALEQLWLSVAGPLSGRWCYSIPPSLWIIDWTETSQGIELSWSFANLSLPLPLSFSQYMFSASPCFSLSFLLSLSNPLSIYLSSFFQSL